MQHIHPDTPAKCNVILTDDDPDDRDFIMSALQRNLYKGSLVHADNGVVLIEALQQVKEDPSAYLPDLIILDLNMPYMDGYQVLQRLKEDPDLRGIPTVVLTSSAKQEDVRACQHLGCSRFYQKPSSLSGYDTIAKDLLVFLRKTNPDC